MITLVVLVAAGWAISTLLTPETASRPTPMQVLQRTLAPLMLWSLVITVPGLAFAWRRALRDNALVQRARATKEELAQLTPGQFERWCAVRLEGLGYRVRHVAGGGDHGIDLVAEKDGHTTVVQCKRNVSSRTVSESQVRDLFGAMHDQQAPRALLMSAGNISVAAKQWARGKPIDLWDREALAALPSSRANGTQPDAATPTAALSTAPALGPCPRCGLELVARTARATGASFVGCSAFPRCRFTRAN